MNACHRERMNKRVLWSVVALVTLTAAVYFARSPKIFRAPAAGNPKNEIAIQDGKTIDFSSGKPVVKDSPEEKKVIDAAVQEMDEAAKNVKFGPPEKKPAPEPAPKK